MNHLAPRFVGAVTREGYVRPLAAAPRVGVSGPYVNALPLPVQNFSQAYALANQAMTTGDRTSLTAAVQFCRAGLNQLPKSQTAIALTTALRAARSGSVATAARAVANIATQAIHLMKQLGMGTQVRAGVGAPRFGLALPRIGLGDLNTSDPTLGDAASALATELESSGCKNAFDPITQAFQTAYNNAGGTPALVVDGLYGAKTQDALQTALNGPVPAGCVAAASSGGGGGGGTVVNNTPPSSSTPSTVNVSSSSNYLPIAIAGVAAAGLVGLAIYAKKRSRTRTRFIHKTMHHHRR